MTDYIKEWKQEELIQTILGFEKAKVLINDYKEKYGYTRFEYEGFRKIPKLYKDLSTYPNEYAVEVFKKNIDRHFEVLQGKVEKKIGKIEMITDLTGSGYDYQIKGEAGNCVIRLVSAGGYNIQIAHTRWIIR